MRKELANAPFSPRHELIRSEISVEKKNSIPHKEERKEKSGNREESSNRGNAISRDGDPSNG